jgi:hypothetical protein
MVRRLPVVQSQPADPERPPWQWVIIGAGFTISLWIPALAVLLWLRGRLLAKILGDDGLDITKRVEGAVGFERLLWLLSVLAPVLLPWMLAAGFAGALLRRFGTGTERKHTLYAGLLATALAAGVALLGGAFDSVAALVSSTGVLGGTAAGSAWLGGKFGERRRQAQ